MHYIVQNMTEYTLSASGSRININKETKVIGKKNNTLRNYAMCIDLSKYSLYAFQVQ